MGDYYTGRTPFLEAAKDQIALRFRNFTMDHTHLVSLTQHSRQHLNHIPERREHDYFARRPLDQLEDGFEPINPAYIMSVAGGVVPKTRTNLE